MVRNPSEVVGSVPLVSTATTSLLSLHITGPPDIPFIPAQLRLKQSFSVPSSPPLFTCSDLPLNKKNTDVIMKIIKQNFTQNEKELDYLPNHSR